MLSYKFALSLKPIKMFPLVLNFSRLDHTLYLEILIDYNVENQLKLKYSQRLYYPIYLWYATHMYKENI